MFFGCLRHLLLRRGEQGPRPGPLCLGICGGPSYFMSFIGPAPLSLFKLDIWACVLGLCAYYFKPNHKLSYTNLKKENIQFPYTYNLTPPTPQTHGGLRETILSLEVKARKVPRGRGLVKILAN